LPSSPRPPSHLADRGCAAAIGEAHPPELIPDVRRAAGGPTCFLDAIIEQQSPGSVIVSGSSTDAGNCRTEIGAADRESGCDDGGAVGRGGVLNAASDLTSGKG
jgi:hypothetical protein